MRRIRPLVVTVVGCVLLGAALTGCGGDDDPAVSPVSRAPGEAPRSVTASGAGPASAMADDPPGTVTCAQLAVAITAGSLMAPGVVDGIVAASRTADAPLADAADRLDAAYRTAVAAAGKDDEPDKIAAVGAAASDMSGVCADSGLQTVG
jgi:hypothetical protein